MRGSRPVATPTRGSDGFLSLKGTQMPKIVFTATADQKCYRKWTTDYIPKFLKYVKALPIESHIMSLTTYTDIWYYRTTEYFGPGKATTLCDGIPRTTQFYATSNTTRDVAVTRTILGEVGITITPTLKGPVAIPQPSKP